MNAPEDFDRAGLDLWFAAQRTLREQSTWRDTDAPLLEQFVRGVTLARSARAAAADEPFVQGSRGQLVAHPALRVARDAEADARAAAGDLLLTPASRRRAGVGEPKTLEDELSSLIG